MQLNKIYFLIFIIVFFSCKKEENAKLIITQLPSLCDTNVYDLPRDYIRVENEISSDSTADITFKFVEPCCEEYGGDFKFENDTLRLEYWQSNEVSCACLCCYQYNFKVIGLDSKPKHISISKKKRIE